MSDATVKVGRLLLLSQGAYSSYQRKGWFVAVQEFSPEAELRQYLQEHQEQSSSYKFEKDQFLAWVLRKGLIVEVEEFFDEWHLGDYSCSSEVAFMPRAAHSAGVSNE